MLPSDLAGGGGAGGADASGSSNTRGGSNWHGIMPYLWLIMCFSQDDVKAAFLHAELDACNSEHKQVHMGVCCHCLLCLTTSNWKLTLLFTLVCRSVTAFELTSNLWTDKDHYNPRATLIAPTNALLIWQPAAMPTKKVLDSFTSMQTDLLRIIRDWKIADRVRVGVLKRRKRTTLTLMMRSIRRRRMYPW